MKNSFKSTAKNQLQIAANEYATLIGKTFVLESKEFVNCDKYVLCFGETNFLHLTGVISDLSPADFYSKCINGTIAESDFDYNAAKNKTNIKNKLRVLCSISTFFNQELQVQEQFIKNKVVCKIATTDNKCTIGFDGGFRLRPKTILKNNHLDTSKPIIKVVPLIN